MYDCYFNDAKDAFEYIHKNLQEGVVVIWSYSSESLQREVRHFNDRVRRLNQRIPNADYQVLVSNPFIYWEVGENPQYVCAEITYGTFSNLNGKTVLFTGWNYEVLKDPLVHSAISSTVTL